VLTEGFKPLFSKDCVKCSTAVIVLLAILRKILFCCLFSLGANGRIQTLVFLRLCQVFYHCATTAGQMLKKQNCSIFSIFSPWSIDRIQNLILRTMWQVFCHCATTAGHMFKKLFYSFVFSQCQRQVSNSVSSALPLCYHNWPYIKKNTWLNAE